MVGKLQNVSGTTDTTAQTPKRSFFNKRNFIIALSLMIICIGGFYLLRNQVFDYFVYDKPFRTLKGHNRRVSFVLFSPNGQMIASGSYDRTIRLWDAASGNLKQTLEANAGGVNALAISPDGQMVASCGPDQELMVFEATNGKLFYVKNFDSNVLFIAFSPDGQTMAVASDRIYLLDAANGNIKYTIPTEEFYALAVAFSPDGKTLAGSFSDETKLWDAANGNLKQTFVKSADSARSLIFSPDGQTLVGASHKGRIFVWEIATGNLKHTLKANSDKVPIAFSPDGQTLASGGDELSKDKERYEGEIEFWDIANGNSIRNFAKQRATISSISFSPDGRMIAAGNNNGTIGLWKVE